MTGGDAASLPDAGAAGEPPMLSGSADAGPAITADAAAALDTEPEPTAAGAEPAPVKPEVYERKATDRDYARVAEAMVRRVDKVVSKLARVPEEARGDLDDVAEMVKPGAEIWGARMGAFFWAAVVVVAVLSLVIAKLAAARSRALPPS